MGKARNHARPSDEGHFSFQADDALVVIRQYFSEATTPKKMPYVLALYSTFVDIASRENTEEFIKSHRELHLLSGMSVPQVKIVKAILRNLRLVAWKQNYDVNGGGQDSNTYRLLSIKSK